MKQTALFFLLFFSLGSLTLTKAQMWIPDNFSLEHLSDGWELPLGLKFDAEGNLFVADKIGRIWRVEDGQKVEPAFLDISDEVDSTSDHGLLGFELHPNFRENGYFYVLYVADRYHLLFEGSPDYDANSSIYGQATQVRVTRFQADAATDFTTVDKSNRRYLLGERLGQGPPILHEVHGGGTIIFAEDGTLLIGTGDGTTWTDYYLGDGPPFFGSKVTQALADGIIQDYEDVGSFRSQITGSLAGKILRIDPETGEGLPSNPWYNADDPHAPESKVWAKGLRNPYRAILRPGSGSSDPNDGLPGSLYVGDVGDLSYEEVNVVVRKGQNFGWPLYEGILKHDTLFDVAPIDRTSVNPLYAAGDCDQEFFSFKDLVNAPTVPQVGFPNPCNEALSVPDELTATMDFPQLTIRHWRPDPDFDGGIFLPELNEDGSYGQVRITHPDAPIPDPESDCSANACIPAGFYRNDQFPEEYHNNLFIGDYVQGWIIAAEFDLNDKLTRVKKFFRDTSFISDVKISPKDGCLYFLDYEIGLKRICYGANLPPIAIAEADSYYGPSPHTVSFSSEGSRDPQEETVTYLWDFGNGQTSTEANPTSTFTASSATPESFTVTLTVTDQSGLETSTSLLISLNNTPPQVTINNPVEGTLFPNSGISLHPLEATVEDAEHDASQLTYRWQKKHIHNTHAHIEQVVNSLTGVAETDPAVCDLDTHYYIITLEVTDAEGLVGYDEVSIFPDCDSPKFVDLLDFSGSAVAEGVELLWSTATETELEVFELYKISSDDAYTLLDSFEPANLSAITTDYSALDTIPQPGINTYRLKLISTDGVEVYSAKQSVIFVDKSTILIYPNPAVEEVYVQIGTMQEEISLQIFDLQGKLMKEKQWIGEVGDVGSISMDISELYTGLYLYRLQNGSDSRSGTLFVGTD